MSIHFPANSDYKIQDLISQVYPDSRALLNQSPRIGDQPELQLLKRPFQQFDNTLNAV